MQKLILAASMALALTGCKEASNQEQSEQAAPAAQNLDAKGIIDALSKSGLPVENITIFTAESDPNGLLGRPNQYTSKAEFYDAERQEQQEDLQRPRAYLEVFEDAERAQARHDYIENVTKDTPFLVQYQILQGNILLRFDKQFSPDKVKAYETALSDITG